MRTVPCIWLDDLCLFKYLSLLLSMKSLEFRCMHCGASFGRNVIGLARHIREQHDAQRHKLQ